MLVREKPLQRGQGRTRNLLKAHFSQLKPNRWPRQATFCACVCTFITRIQSWALNTTFSFKYWQDVVRADVSKKWVLRILRTKDLEMSDTDDLRKGISFTEATNMNTQPPKSPMIMSHWAMGCILTSKTWSLWLTNGLHALSPACKQNSRPWNQGQTWPNCLYRRRGGFLSSC